MAATHSLPDALAGFICVTEVDAGRFFVEDLFQRKFASSPPDFGRHIVAFYKDSRGGFLPASYLHLWTQGSIGLVGGGCTDGRVLRMMNDTQRRALTAEGGLLRQTLLYCFTQFATGLEAFFGHCGDVRAKEVDLAAGFVETEDPYLLVRWTQPLSSDRQRTLFVQALDIGAF